MTFAPSIETTDSTMRLTVPDAEKLIPRLIEIASQYGVQVKSVSIHKPTLNDVFLYYTGREIRAEEAESDLKTQMRSWSKMR